MLRTSNRTKAVGVAAGYLIPVAGLLAAGGVAAGIAGFLAAAALIVVAAPVVGFTRNQIMLSDKGRRLAKTVAEIRSLKEADSLAFASFFMARYVTAASYRQLTADPAAPGDSRPSLRQCPEGCARACEASLAPAGRDPSADSSPTFWASLDEAERASLAATARRETSPAGSVLCRQGDIARHVFVIIAGQVMVWVTQPGERRCVAVRGPGDIVGERSAFEVRSRSATVVATAPVEALVITTTDFAIFLNHHPRVLRVLETQVYDRLVEDRPAQAAHVAGIAPERPAWSGLNCSIFLADIAAFGRPSRNDKDRQRLRASMYAILEGAFESSGISWQTCYREDRGDGVLVIVPPRIPTSLLIAPLPNDLATALAAHNEQATDAVRMQLRVSLNVGPVVSDHEGVCGESIILAARILEAPVLKRQLASESADLGLIVSAYVYDTVVKHAPEHVVPTQYRQVRVRVKESRLDAWVCLLSGSMDGEVVRESDRRRAW
jgi:CRP-like cAMP-binding protein